MTWEWLASLQAVVDLIGRLIPRREMIPPTHRGIKYCGMKTIKVLQPGVYWYWPWRSAIRQACVVNRLISLVAQYVTTADGKTVWVDGSILFCTYDSDDDVVRAFVETEDIDSVSAAISMACMNELMERTQWSELQDRAKFNQQWRSLLRRSLRRYGIRVKRANIETLATGKPIMVLGIGR